jgi:hypothetical protein
VAVARAVEVLGVALVHLVLHDSALAVEAAFAYASPSERRKKGRKDWWGPEG